MNNTLVQKASRQFSPLILYHKHDSFDYQQSLPNKQKCQPHSIHMETRISQHLAKTNDMLERNAELWTIQECTSYATLSDEAPPLKKGFVNVILTNETTTDQNEKDINDIIASSSTSSTLSNSSSADSNDSTISITTPICSTRTIPISTLVISQSPTSIPMEPKANNRPLSSLYQPNTYTMPGFYRLDANDNDQYLHHHDNQPPTHAAKPLLPIQQYLDHANTPTIGFVASSPHDGRSKKWKNDDEHRYNNKHPRPRATELSPSSSTSHFSHPHRKKDMNTGMKKRRRGNLPKHVTEFLKNWLLQHKEHPYPTERQKLELAQCTDLAVNQVSNWFINARRRILHPMLETEQQHLRHQYSYLNRYQHHRYYSSPVTTTTFNNTSTTLTPSTLLVKEEQEKWQHPWDIYAAPRHDAELEHSIHHWSAHRTTKLPTIQISGKDQHLFAAVS